MSRRRRVSTGQHGWGDLESLDSVISQTKKRADSRQNIHMPSVLDLNLRYVDSSPVLPKGGYMAKIDGQELPLGDGAVRTACKMIKSRPDYFKQFADKSAFAQDLRNVLDNPARKGPKGFLVRTGLAPNGIGEEIAAILPSDYRIRDAHTGLEEFGGMLNDFVGNIKGVSRVESGYGDISSYRVVVGENIMARTNEINGQLMMFVYSMSETGQKADSTTLGIYRLVCTNGAMSLQRGQTLANWDHKAPMEDYLEKSATAIRRISYFSDAWGKIFNDLLAAPLQMEAGELLHGLSEESLISAKHFAAAERLSVTGPVETQFDFFNLLTRSAQDLPSVKSREDAEGSALRLFTTQGGVMEHLRKAISRSSGKGKGGPSPFELPPDDES